MPLQSHLAVEWSGSMLLRVCVLFLCSGLICVADDWPQWMGPQRDNIWRETGIIEQFPEGGPKVLWRTPIAGGYSGPAVAAGRVVITDYVTSDNVKVDNFQREEFTGTERVLCLDEATGQTLWKHEYPVKYSISYPAGPRCTPVIQNGRVYTLGAEGHLFCFDFAAGGVVWSKDLKATYGTKAALWGYAAHPLIDGDKLLCLAGGEGSHIVAFDKSSGTEIWRSSTSPEQGYSPPTIIEAGGVRQLVLLRPDAVSAVNPETGEEYWSVPYEATSGSIIMSPVKVGDYLYAAGYSQKSLMLRLDSERPGVSEVWRNKKNVISPVNVQPFAEGNVIYGMDQKGVLRAISVPDGDMLWESTDAIGGRPRGSETAFLVKNGDRFVSFNELGELLFLDISPAGCRVIDRAKVIDQTNVAFGRDVVWAMPAFANKHAYVRNDSEIICVDLAK
jgi:outer membrane protein assembly factor BamB